MRVVIVILVVIFFIAIISKLKLLTKNGITLYILVSKNLPLNSKAKKNYIKIGLPKPIHQFNFI